jgi:hypothetical protein
MNFYLSIERVRTAEWKAIGSSLSYSPIGDSQTVSGVSNRADRRRWLDQTLSLQTVRMDLGNRLSQ